MIEFAQEVLDVLGEIFDSLSSLLPDLTSMFDFVPSFMWPLVSVYLVVSVTYLFVGRG